MRSRGTRMAVSPPSPGSFSRDRTSSDGLLGLPPATPSLAAYRGSHRLVIDVGDAADAAHGGEVAIHVTNTRIHQRHEAARLASFIMELI
jgi:hypothetical protein